MRFITSLLGSGSPKVMGRQYMKVGRNALFGVKTDPAEDICTEKVPKPLSLLIFKKGKLRHGRITAICLGLLALVIGIVLSSIPWVDYIILKQLRLWNGSISFHYWQKPGVVRLTKVYIFNVTNTEGFLQFNEKPKLQEVGPFVFREDMEKVNIVFHNNGTISYQHKKILNFVPEMSIDKNTKIIIPNIPLLTVSDLTKNLPRVFTLGLSMFVSGMHMKPFIPVTFHEFAFGYDDPFVSLGHTFLPEKRRPLNKMGFLLGRNGTLKEVHTLFTGNTDMKKFGYLNRLNGLDHLPFWSEAPCNSITASEGSFFPPRDITGADIVYVYDKDLCRVLAMQYRGPVMKTGIRADLYTPTDNTFDYLDKSAPENKCFCEHDFDTCPPRGLQSISPCQYNAPIYISFPHFYKADPKLLDSVVGLNPVEDLHNSYIKIQPKLGVPLEAKLRLQMNLMVKRQPNIAAIANFPDIIFPIMWLEEGMEELPPVIRRLIFLSTSFVDIVVPCFTYGLILVGLTTIVVVFVKVYNSPVLAHEAIELGKRTIRRSSSFLINGQHRLMAGRDSYVLLSNDIDENQDIIET
ncbi:scavenger receptor class B member 1 [Odontomachus brunneus]|uniref:scavenger receptor class B member 1 n=1 Tax=Odontomachus brunneus TaxID=486640 RepID=UPI0013F2A304|nr:scavenger receptor class B member 1 [Odontomachus brunneus]XP_032674775.1 scavenger receptor class B member 1 [Odontomachus brunneus]